jgi:hypothetical protein
MTQPELPVEPFSELEQQYPHAYACEEIATLLRGVDGEIGNLTIVAKHKTTLRLMVGALADAVEALR